MFTKTRPIDLHDFASNFDVARIHPPLYVHLDHRYYYLDTKSFTIGRKEISLKEIDSFRTSYIALMIENADAFSYRILRNLAALSTQRNFEVEGKFHIRVTTLNASMGTYQVQLKMGANWENISGSTFYVRAMFGKTQYFGLPDSRVMVSSLISTSKTSKMIGNPEKTVYALWMDSGAGGPQEILYYLPTEKRFQLYHYHYKSEAEEN